MSCDLDLLNITSTDLETWANSLESRAQLPQLIEKLILATAPDVLKCRIPYGDDIVQPGYDGVVLATKDCRHVPAGISYWEMGTNKNVLEKAKGDYDKRSNNATKANIQDKTFVFVTPRRSGTLHTWGNKVRSEKIWKDVRVIDASILSNWINEHPCVKLWFLKIIGKHVQGAEHLEWLAEKWKKVCSPQLPDILFEYEVKRHSKNVSDWFNQCSEKYLDIHAESEEEAFAFLFALFSEEPFKKYLSRTIVISNIEAIDSLRFYINRDLVPIITNNDVGRHICTTEPCTHIIRITTSEEIYPSPFRLNLGLLSSTAIEQTAAMYFKTYREQQSVILESGFSRTILRHLLSNNRCLKEPKWLNDTAIDNDLLIALLLCGYWMVSPESSDKECFHNQFISKIRGLDEKTCDKTYSDLLALSEVPDSPIWHESYDGTHYFGMKIYTETLRALVTRNRIKSHHWERFIDCAFKIFHEAIFNDSSATLNIKEYILRVCILLDSMGLEVFRSSLFSPSRIRDRIAEILFSIPFQEIISNSGKHLPLIAESWPEQYLEKFSRFIDTGDKEQVSLVCKQYLWEVVQSLECTAVVPRFFEHSVFILTKLHNIMENDRDAIREAVYNLFCWWHPQTNASASSANRVASKLLSISRDLAWYIATRMFKVSGDYASVNYSARFRGGEWVIPECNREDQSQCEILKNWAGIVGAWKHLDKGEIIAHINILHRLMYEDRETSWKNIQESIHNLAEEDKTGCHMSIRQYVRMLYRNIDETKNADFITLKKSAVSCIHDTPIENPYLRESWIFLYETHRLLSVKKYTGKEDLCRMRLSRLAIRRLRMQNCTAYQKLLISDSSDTSLLGMTLSSQLNELELFKFLKQCACDRSLHESKLQSLIRVIILNTEQNKYNRLCMKLEEVLSPEELFPLLITMPWSTTLCKMVNRLPYDFREKYWTSANSFILTDDRESNILLIERLIEAGRSEIALKSMWYKIFQQTLHDYEVALLCKVLDNLYKQNNLPSIISGIEYEISKALDLLEKIGISHNKLVYWEFRYGLDTYCRDTLSERLMIWLWEHPRHFVRLIKHYSYIVRKEINNPILSKLYMRIFHEAGMIGYIPSNFSFYNWVEQCVHYASLYDCISPVRYDCIRILGLTRKKYGAEWPNNDICRAIDFIHNETVEGAFVSGIISSVGCYCVPPSDYGLGCNAINSFEKQARNIETKYPRIAELIRTAGSFYQRDADTQRDESKILRRLGKSY